jgi:tetratricopeptide (TPR) repeat protein
MNAAGTTLNRNDELRSALERIDAATAKMVPGEKLKFIDAELAKPLSDDLRSQIEISKGLTLRAAGLERAAAEYLEQCAAKPNSPAGANYLAAQHLVQVGEFARAMPCLNRCLEQGEVSGNKWFETAAYLLRAYCAAKLGKFDLAREDLARSDDNDSMWWIVAEPPVAQSCIASMIAEKT